MPETDGIELIRQVSDDPGLSLPRVVLMITAFDRDQLNVQAKGLPIRTILTKPTTPSDIYDAVATALSENGQAGLNVKTTLTNQLEGLRALVVEDNGVNQLVARELLTRMGAVVRIAGLGKTALQILAENPKGFDVVLMDIQMPEMDGYESTRAIRDQLGLTDLPIVAMTANAMEIDRRRTREAGMVGHLSKPIDVEELVAALKGFVSPKKARPASDSGKLSLPSKRPSLPAQVPGIDVAATLERLGGDQELFLSAYALFVSQQEQTIAECREAMKQGRREEAASILHRLRGVAANLGATEVAARTMETEASLAEDRGLEELDRLDTAMQALLESARQLLTTFRLQTPS